MNSKAAVGVAAYKTRDKRKHSQQVSKAVRSANVVLATPASMPQTQAVLVRTPTGYMCQDVNGLCKRFSGA